MPGNMKVCKVDPVSSNIFSKDESYISLNMMTIYLEIKQWGKPYTTKHRLIVSKHDLLTLVRAT